MTYAVAVIFEVFPERMDDFLPLVRSNARTSLAEEPGCRRFDVCTDPGAPGVVFLYEHYADRAAFDVHLNSPHFCDFDELTAPMISAKEVRCFAQVWQ